MPYLLSVELNDSLIAEFDEAYIALAIIEDPDFKVDIYRNVINPPFAGMTFAKTVVMTPLKAGETTLTIESLGIKFNFPVVINEYAPEAYTLGEARYNEYKYTSAGVPASPFLINSFTCGGCHTDEGLNGAPPHILDVTSFWGDEEIKNWAKTGKGGGVKGDQEAGVNHIWTLESPEVEVALVSYIRTLGAKNPDAAVRAQKQKTVRIRIKKLQDKPANDAVE
jgi:mono/diheme cytochrome c family protein